MAETQILQASEAIKRIREQGDNLFGKRITWVSLWQEVADNFYVERADFIYQKTPYQHLANMLTTSFPLTVRRDLANVFSTMLRPRDKDWFYMKPMKEELEDLPSRQWLERSAMIMRRAMYDTNSQFTRATKEGDNDFAAFGQAVITVEMNVARDGLLYRCWHIRDVAWQEDSQGKITTVHRKWKPTVADLCQMFPNTVHAKVKEKFEREPFSEVQCRHIVVPFESYKPSDGKIPQQRRGRYAYKYWSVYLDADNDSVLEEKPMSYMMYVIPRWQTVSGSQYSLSPCAAMGVPDARTLQAMSLSILEGTEWAATPPFLATEEAIRSDLNLIPRGVTWVDPDYNEKTGEALRPITNDIHGLPTAIQMLTMKQQELYSIFYLNKVGLPPVTDGMTAYEASQRVAEYIRNALPIFEPMEAEYNGGLCQASYDILYLNGAFGPDEDMPDAIRDAAIQFHFVSPLTEAKEMQKSQQFLQAMGIVAEAAKIDPDAILTFDTDTAMRDALEGVSSATWLRTPEQVAQLKQAKAAAQEQQQTLANLQQGGMAAKSFGDAAASFSNAQQNATANPVQ